MYKKKIVGSIIIAAITIITLASITSINFSKEYASQKASYVDVSWPVKYANVAELTKSSDIIIVGKVADLIRTDVDPSTNLTQSYFDVTVITPVEPATFDQKNIVVTQTGGMNKNGMLEVDDDPIMKPGDTVVLFLNHGVPSSLYHVVGGPQGRFIVTNDNVSSLDVIYPDRVGGEKISLHIDGQSLSDFINNIKVAKG